MSMKDKTIKIIDWVGNILFIGPYDDSEVDKILDANRCTNQLCGHGDSSCSQCGDTGYIGDFTISWIDEQNDVDGMNVYEYVAD